MSPHDNWKRHLWVKSYESEIAADFLKMKTGDVCQKWGIGQNTLYSLPRIRKARLVKVMLEFNEVEIQAVVKEYRDLVSSRQPHKGGIAVLLSGNRDEVK